MYPRLKILRESLGMTQEEFGKSVNVAKSTYNNYETGIRDPKSDFWIAVAQKYNVTIDYLMGFSDDPHKTSDETKKEPPTQGGELSKEELALIELFRRIPQEQRRAMLQAIEMTLRSQELL